MTYYDRRGRPVTDEEFDQLDSDPAYRQLAAHKVHSLTRPDQVAWVSTIWRGRDDVEVAGQVDRIFATEVFSETVMDIDGCEQWYETEQHALAGHREVVAWVGDQFECPTAEDVRAGDAPAEQTVDIIAAIDTALGCQQCGNDLGTSPSPDFCREWCQQDWHRAHVGAVAIPDPAGRLRFSDLIRHDPGLHRADYTSWAAWVTEVERDLNRRLLDSCTTPLSASCTTPLDGLYFVFETQEL